MILDSEHVTEADIEQMLSSRASGDEKVGEKVLAHCQVCPECNELLKDCKDIHREIESLKNLSSSTDQTVCPSTELWIKLASGVMDEKEAMELVKHASGCRPCSQELIRAQAYVSDEPVQVPGLQSATPEWQKSVARIIAAHPPVVKERKAKRWRFFWITAATAAVVAFAVVIVNIARPRDVNQLLAQAYGQNRTLELRFPGAQYGPMRTERSGNSQSILNQSPALLEALPLISRHLEKEPGNPIWLNAKGRADLLGKNYAAAIQSFQKALEADPDSPLLLTDAASAYFERAQIADRPEDYGKAIELLSQALTKNPDDPIALYNRALVNEKMFLFHQAVEDWTHYLRVAPKGEWADEATRHLEAVRKKLAEQEARAAEPLLDPGMLFHETASSNQQASDILDHRSEDYLDRAIRKWLPAAFATRADSLGSASVDRNLFQAVSFSGAAANILQSAGPQTRDSPQPPPESSPTRLALSTLAEVLKMRHGDEWLSDLLKASHSPFIIPAIHALAEATDANATGDFDLARRKSNESVVLFQRSGNAAGTSRALYEMVYALERTELGKRCLDAALPLANDPSTHRYSWIQVQLGVARASCWAQIGQFDEAATSLNEALARAEKSGYGALYLRALGIAASLLTSQGNGAAASSMDLRGLTHYWNGSYPPMRAHQFYSDLGFPAHETGKWNFALALEKEATSTIALTEQRLGEALTRQRLAKAAFMAGDQNLAAAEFNRSRELFASSPSSKAMRAWQASEEIELAKLEADRGEVDQSSAHLLDARKQLPQIVNYFIALHFFQTSGELQSLKGNRKEAELALRAAVTASEWGLSSSRSERERIRWAREAGQTYRDLAEIYWKSNDAEKALKVWEWYRGAAVRNPKATSVLSDIAGARLQSSDIAFAGLDSGPPLPPMEGILGSPSAFQQTTVVSYMQLATGLAVWVFDDRGITAKWIAVPPQKLVRLARNFRDECADPGSDLTVLRHDARQLYDLLIAPMSDHLSPDRMLVIEPDDAIAEVPVAALMDPSGRYLGEIYPLVFSPGLLYQRRLHSAQNFTPHQRALAIGAPALGGDLAASLGPLGDATDEARYVATKFEKATVFTGRQASLINVRRELPRAAIFHFAGHAVANAEELGLMLAGPHSPDAQVRTTTVLNVSGLTSIDLQKLQLAVLSACSTATGDEDEPRDPENLVRIFLRAGVPHVVASRWNVNSNTTAKFMRIFYDHLLDHGSVSGSLQAAGAELRRTADTAHPYYWAAFSAFGR